MKRKFELNDYYNYNKKGFTPLHLAVLDNDLIKTADLIALGADISAPVHNENDCYDAPDLDEMNDLEKGNNIAHLAMKHGFVDIVDYLAKQLYRFI